MFVWLLISVYTQTQAGAGAGAPMSPEPGPGLLSRAERGNKPIVNAVAECNDDMQWQCELKAIIYFLSRFIVHF